MSNDIELKEDEIDISGLDKAELLRRLYNGKGPVGMGMLHFIPGDATIEQATEWLMDRGEIRFYFDYVFGRPIKADLRGDKCRFDLYDRDAYPGAFQAIVDAMRAES